MASKATMYIFRDKSGNPDTFIHSHCQDYYSDRSASTRIWAGGLQKFICLDIDRNSLAKQLREFRSNGITIERKVYK